MPSHRSHSHCFFVSARPSEGVLRLVENNLVMSFETIRFYDGTGGASAPVLELLDQRLLPGEVRYVQLRTAKEVADAIRNMVVRGAPAIGISAGYGYCIGAFHAEKSCGGIHETFKSLMSAVYDVLFSSRPTAVNLQWALDRLRSHAMQETTGTSVTEAVQDIFADARAIAKEDESACRKMGALGAELVPCKGARILHHCNTGSLATSIYGTALGLIRAAFDADPSIHVWIDETRPRLQGARLTAWECVQEKIPHTLIVDSAAAMLMAAGKVDIVTVGADRIAADGSVANKIGTYSLSVNANYHGIPFVVVAPTSTVDLQTRTGADIPVEERSRDEIVHPCGDSPPSIAPETTAVYNPGKLQLVHFVT